VRPAPRIQRRIATFVPPLLVALLALPFVLHQNAWWEWSTALWLLERQAAYVSAHGAPTLFLHSGAGAFNAFYVFYGGLTFSILAYPAAVLGAWPVFAAATAGAMAAGYAGIWWTARNLGLSHQLAILPAAAFATTPYLLTDLYGRGAWAELVAVNAAAVMLGGLTALVWRPDRRYGRAFAALAASGAVVAGTHNVTLLVSTLLLPLLLLAVLPLAPRSAGLRGTVKRLTRGLVAVVLGVGLTGAWLVPNLWLGPDTYISDPAISHGVLQEKVELLRISNVLSPWPAKPAADPGRWIYAQGPVLAMAWTLMALSTIVWARRRRPDRVTAAAGALVAVSTGVLLLIVDPQWWAGVPPPGPGGPVADAPDPLPGDRRRAGDHRGAHRARGASGATADDRSAHGRSLRPGRHGALHRRRHEGRREAAGAAAAPRRRTRGHRASDLLGPESLHPGSVPDRPSSGRSAADGRAPRRVRRGPDDVGPR
jgi:hypothetical protein